MICYHEKYDQATVIHVNFKRLTTNDYNLLCQYYIGVFGEFKPHIKKTSAFDNHK